MSWDRLVGSYEHVADLYEAKFLHELEAKPRDRTVLTAFASLAGDPVVELGCGPGQVGAFVRASGRRVVGFDLSPAMARRAAGRLDAAVVGDLRRLPFAAGALGGVLAYYSLIHVRRAEVPATFFELGRVLRPGGRLLLAVHEGEGELAVDEFLGEPVPFVATLFGLDELVDGLTAAGFEVALAERRRPYAMESTVRLIVEAVRR